MSTNENKGSWGCIIALNLIVLIVGLSIYFIRKSNSSPKEETETYVRYSPEIWDNIVFSGLSYKKDTILYPFFNQDSVVEFFFDRPLEERFKEKDYWINTVIWGKLLYLEENANLKIEFNNIEKTFSSAICLYRFDTIIYSYDKECCCYVPTIYGDLIEYIEDGNLVSLLKIY